MAEEKAQERPEEPDQGAEKDSTGKGPDAGPEPPEGGQEDVRDSHGQPGINKERHDREVRALNDKIAELEQKVAEASKSEESREEMAAQIDGLRAELRAERDTVALERLGCVDTDVALRLLGDYESAKALKEAKPYLFESGRKGPTGLKPEGAADDARAAQAKADAALGYRRPK